MARGVLPEWESFSDEQHAADNALKFLSVSQWNYSTLIETQRPEGDRTGTSASGWRCLSRWLGRQQMLHHRVESYLVLQQRDLRGQPP